MTDLSMVCYRRDMLAKPASRNQAHSRPPNGSEETLHRLQQAGIAAPWVVPTQRSYINVHNLACGSGRPGRTWWTRKRSSFLFNQPAVRSAILSFFSLYRYISRNMQNLAEREADQMFLTGKPR